VGTVENYAPAGDYLVKPDDFRQAYDIPGYVYVIQWGEDGPVKIGQAIDPKSRMGELQVANWMELRLAAVVPIFGALTPVEKTSHRLAIAHLLSGEWFDLEPVEAVSHILAAAEICGQPVYPIAEAKRLTKQNRALALGAQIDAEKALRRERNGWSN
jgi:hypothetical protein